MRLKARISCHSETDPPEPKTIGRGFRSKGGLALLIALCLMVFTSAPEAFGQARKKVVIGQGPSSLVYSAVYVAVAQMPDFGLDGSILFFRGGAEAMAALFSSNSQVYIGPPSTAMKAIAQGQDLRVFGAIIGDVPEQLVIQGDIARKKGITAAMPVAQRIAALRGLTIGTSPPGSAPYQVLRYIMSAEKFTADRDLTIAPLGDTGPLLAALEQKRIDGFIYSQPAADIATANFDGVIVVDLAKGEYPALRDILYHTLVGKTDWLAADPDRAARVVASFAKAIRLMRDDPAKAKAAIRPYFKDMAQEDFDSGFAAAAAPLVSSMRIEPRSIELNRDFVKVGEGLVLDMPVDKVYTNTYVDRAEKLGK